MNERRRRRVVDTDGHHGSAGQAEPYRGWVGRNARSRSAAKSSVVYGHRRIRCLNRRSDIAHRRRRVDHAAYARISIPIQRRTFRSTATTPHVMTLVRLEHARLLHPVRVPVGIERLRAVDHRTADVDRLRASTSLETTGQANLPISKYDACIVTPRS